jgi:hypothetical protein
MKNASYSRGWTRKRFAHLVPPITVTEIVQKLKVHDSTVRHWIRDPEFKQAEIATQDRAGVWVFDRDRLWAWLMAIGSVQRLPDSDEPTSEQAAEFLGIEPRHYRPAKPPRGSK